MVSRARQQGIELNPKDLFQQPTIQQLALRAKAAEDTLQPPAALIDMPLHGLNDAQLAALPWPEGQLDGLYRLSPMQQGMLFLGLNSPDADLYINQLCIPVQGLERLRFKAAWEAVSRRHDILRTGFLWQDMAEPLQFVLADPQLPISLLDWRDQDHSAEALQQLADSERAKGFDLDRPPLQRLTLVQVGEDSYQLIWTYHHILIDGWSSSQLIGEVLSQYSGQALPEAVPYRRYINWLQQQDANASEGFWREQLAQLDEPTYLADAVPRRGRATVTKRFTVAWVKPAPSNSRPSRNPSKSPSIPWSRAPGWSCSAVTAVSVAWRSAPRWRGVRRVCRRRNRSSACSSTPCR